MPKKTPQKKRAKKTTATSAKPVCPIPKQNVLSRENRDGTIAVMDLLQDEHFFIIDKIAAECWRLFDGKTSLEKITAKLAAKHDVSPDALAKDIRALVADLQKKGLI